MAAARHRRSPWWKTPISLPRCAAIRAARRWSVGFAAETDDVIAHAVAKRARKGGDWIVANDVSGDVMGGLANTVHIIDAAGVDSLPEMPKDAVAQAIVARIRNNCRHNCQRNPSMTTPSPAVPILFKRLPHGEGLPLPAYATPGAAGMDVVAAEDVDLAPGARMPWPRAWCWPFPRL
jgi:phosphopantothenoylcysteine decarboxylase/phosphopantothenate--cysteine ligase